MMFAGQENILKMVVEEALSKERGRSYLNGVDAIFAEEEVMPIEERRLIIQKAETIKNLIVNEKGTVEVPLNLSVAKDIKERLETEGGYGEWLRKYKEMLEIKFGIVKEFDDDKRNIMINEGEKAAKKLFFVKNPRFKFSLV